MNLSDKIVDLAAESTDGPALAMIGVVEALCRIAIATGIPDVRAMLHFQLDELLNDLIPKFAAENTRQAAG